MGRSTFPFCTTSETNWLQICGDPSDFCHHQVTCSHLEAAAAERRQLFKKKKKKNNEKTKQMQRNQDGSKH